MMLKRTLSLLAASVLFAAPAIFSQTFTCNPLPIITIVSGNATYSFACPMTASAVGTTGPGTVGSTVPGSTTPGTTLPGTTLPGTTLPGTTLPGTTVPTTASFPNFPATYALNQSVASLPVNARMVTGNWNTGATEKINDGFHSVFGGAHMHMDLSIPYNIVDSKAHPEVLAPVNVTLYAGDSDAAPSVPVVGQAVEGGLATVANNGGNDHHLLVYDKATGILHEFYRFAQDGNAYSAESYAQWLGPNKVTTRTMGKTSADAAGLAITPWLLKYDEAASGVISHSLRVTMNLTRANGNGGYMVAPATHSAGNNWGTPVAVGHRIRLRANFDISGYSATNQAILKCLKTYGAVVADNGGSFYINGTPDARWNDDDLSKIGTVAGTDFDIVDSGDMMDLYGTIAK